MKDKEMNKNVYKARISQLENENLPLIFGLNF